jgi:NAD(P)H-dependent flavin oxidoreductase YrpB (nitropropane dioxygenase family)
VGASRAIRARTASRRGLTIVRLRRSDVEVPLVNYTVMAPTDYTEGQIERLALYAGQSCSLVHEILPAGEIVRRITSEAADLITNRLAPLIHGRSKG